jgi:nicotinate-nucleotide adenylyltransferase
MRNTERIAFFGGTFDPPHNGHLHLVVSLKEFHHLDRVYILPAHQNPLKPCFTEPRHRLEMTRLAFSPLPYCEVLDIEIMKPPPSFAIDTIQSLIERDERIRKAERFFLLGSDAVLSIPEWKEADLLFSLTPPLIAARGSSQFSLPPHLDAFVQKGMTPTGQLDISSTDIRDRLKRSLFVGHLVPESVLQYIFSHKLYKNKL